MKYRLFWLFGLFFLAGCATFSVDIQKNREIEAIITRDIRVAEKEISLFLGYKMSPLPPVSVKYVPYEQLKVLTGEGIISAAAMYNDDTIYISRGEYKKRQGYQSEKIRTFFNEIAEIRGYVGYYHTIYHETAHYFFTNLTGWKNEEGEWGNGDCGKNNEGRAIANEGFADYIALHFLVEKSKITKDPKYEEYAAKKFGYGLIWKNTKNSEKIYTLKDFPTAPNFSPRSQFIIQQMASRYLKEKPKTPCETNDIQECFVKKYAFGLFEAYKWKEKYPEGRWDDGSIAKFMCTYNMQ